ncbi:uncharacterized protein LOC121765465 [Salvia splendens]|uniref:uncharacterized protein LOC121765465 n=1 Tax=Salvia splendens TaxID=180675 RepID=UPI001C27BD5C|nr:uncharacterized protein LOC121765465 [Salvia splendens]
MEAERIQELKGFVDFCKQNPHLLHTPSLAFFKNFLQSFGARMLAFGGSSNDGEDHEDKKPFDSRKRYVPMDISNDGIAESGDNQEAAQLSKANAMETIAEGEIILIHSGFLVASWMRNSMLLQRHLGFQFSTSPQHGVGPAVTSALFSLAWLGHYFLKVSWTVEDAATFAIENFSLRLCVKTLQSLKQFDDETDLITQLISSESELCESSVRLYDMSACIPMGILGKCIVPLGLGAANKFSVMSSRISLPPAAAHRFWIVRNIKF